MIDMIIDEQNTIFHDEKMMLKLPDPCFVGHAVKIDEIRSHKYSYFQIVFLDIFLLYSENRMEDFPSIVFGFVLHALVMENGPWKMW
jgi:hypothetical protein